jgi:hypothetical protein
MFARRALDVESVEVHGVVVEIVGVHVLQPGERVIH